jgi:hypothetical protein
MALSLDGETYEAIQRLRNDSSWRRFVTCVEDHANRFFNQALDAPPEQRIDNIAYARAFRDLLVVIMAAEQNTTPGHVVKPPVVRREKVHA